MPSFVRRESNFVVGFDVEDPADNGLGCYAACNSIFLLSWPMSLMCYCLVLSGSKCLSHSQLTLAIIW